MIVGLTAGQQSDEILVDLNSLQIVLLGFSHNVTNAFQSVFSLNVYCKGCFGGT